jgi:Uma2 family endonuclease
MRESRMPADARLVTAEELEKFPDDDYRYELVDGRVIRMSPVGFEHGRLVVRLGVLLGSHVQNLSLGEVVTEVGFKLASNPDTVRGPDLAFIRQSRIPARRLRGFWNGPPDLVIEVLSPDDRAHEIRAKVEEYLERGVTAVVVVDPDDRSVTIYRASAAVTLRAADELLDLDDVVGGFVCSLQEIFG